MPIPLDSLQPKKNLCRSCNEDFGSLTAFDKHRIGTHSYTFLEGMDMNPPREDGRCCLDEAEMLERGFLKNSYGRWSVSAFLTDSPRAQTVRA
jgi:hypothetical protein